MSAETIPPAFRQAIHEVHNHVYHVQLSDLAKYAISDAVFEKLDAMMEKDPGTIETKRMHCLQERVAMGLSGQGLYLSFEDEELIQGSLSSYPHERDRREILQLQMELTRGFNRAVEGERRSVEQSNKLEVILKPGRLALLRRVGEVMRGAFYAKPRRAV